VAIEAIKISLPFSTIFLLPFQLPHKHPLSGSYFHQIDTGWEGGDIQARAGACHGDPHDFGVGQSADCQLK